MLAIMTGSAEETHKVGEAMGRKLFPSSIVALMGELGSGKTTLVQGIARGLGITSPVKSPSFLIIHEYQGFLPLYHLDLYRIRNEEEIIINLGFEEYLYKKGGVVVIEWADKIKSLLKTDHLRVRLEMRNLYKRRITLEPQGPLYARIVKKMRGEIREGEI